MLTKVVWNNRWLMLTMGFIRFPIVGSVARFTVAGFIVAGFTVAVFTVARFTVAVFTVARFTVDRFTVAYPLPDENR